MPLDLDEHSTVHSSDRTLGMVGALVKVLLELSECSSSATVSSVDVGSFKVEEVNS